MSIGFPQVNKKSAVSLPLASDCVLPHGHPCPLPPNSLDGYLFSAGSCDAQFRSAAAHDQAFPQGRECALSRTRYRGSRMVRFFNQHVTIGVDCPTSLPSRILCSTFPGNGQRRNGSCFIARFSQCLRSQVVPMNESDGLTSDAPLLTAGVFGYGRGLTATAFANAFHFVFSFLGVFQYGLLHFPQRSGTTGFFGIHVWLQRRHVNVGSLSFLMLRSVH